MFFLIYINDFNNALVIKPRLFVNDACLPVNGLNPEELQFKINKELQNLHLWGSVNKLLINATKTKIMIIPPKQTKVQILHLDFISNGSLVNIVSSTKYLEVITEKDFRFKDHSAGLGEGWLDPLAFYLN